MQLNLFNNSEKPETQIFGLQLLTHYIPEEIEYNLITEIDSHLWLNDLSRRVQHYGYKYDYKAKAVSDLIRLEIIPNWLDIISTKLKLENHFKEEPNQIIINEYIPGQGISNHIDCEPCFGNVIASLSLASDIVMNFTNVNDSAFQIGHIVPILLPRRSLLIITGNARYNWQHGIKKVKWDTFNNLKLKRNRRISITFRNVKQSNDFY